MHQGVLLCCVGYILFLTAVKCATEEEEAAANKVSISFYQMSESQWVKKQPGFKSTVSGHATVFCQNMPAKCGLLEWQSSFDFTEEEVDIDPKAVVDRISLRSSFGLRFNPTILELANVTNQTNYVLNKAALQDIVTDYRKEIGEAVGFSIIEIDGESFSPAPDVRMNIIMSICAGVLLIVIIIITLACYCYRKHKDKQEERAYRNNYEKARGTSKVGPNQEKEPKKNWNEEDRENKKHRHYIENVDDRFPDRVKPSNYYRETVESDMYHGDVRAAVPVDGSRGQRTILPPLQAHNAVNEREPKQRKSKRKQRKGSKRRIALDEGLENRSYVETESTAIDDDNPNSGEYVFQASDANYGHQYTRQAVSSNRSTPDSSSSESGRKGEIMTTEL